MKQEMGGGPAESTHILDMIHEYHREDIDSPSHPSMLSRGEGYDVLLFRVPLTLQDDSPYTYAFIVVENQVFRYIRERGVVEEVKDGFSGLHAFLDGATDHAMGRVSAMQEDILDMENDVFEGVSAKEFNKRWHGIRKHLMVIERISLRSGRVTRGFISDYRETDGFPETEFFDLHEHILRNERTVALMLRKLDDLYTMYATINNERINNTIYLLTIISGIFLPLNLVVGFFGMNTGGLPFSTMATGTVMVGVVMVLIVTMIVVFFFLLRLRRNRSNGSLLD